MKKLFIIVIPMIVIMLNWGCKELDSGGKTPELEIDSAAIPVNDMQGVLHYYEQLRIWGVKYRFPEWPVHAKYHFLIKKLNCDSIPFTEGAAVLVSGYCYRTDEVSSPESDPQYYFNIYVSAIKPDI